MKRLALVWLVAAVCVPAALAWPGRPAGPAPTPPNPGAPPPAWIETAQKSAWLAYGSYCWGGSGRAACVDMLPVQTRPDLPLVRAARRATLRIHLALRNPKTTLTVAGKPVRIKVDATRRIVSWQATGGGILQLSVRAAGGTASYVARLRLG